VRFFDGLFAGKFNYMLKKNIPVLRTA